jgi:hypothetical protein
MTKPHEVKSENDLLNYLHDRMSSGDKNWFGFPEQRLTGVALAHEIAARHADKFTPEQVVDYVVKLNNAIYTNMMRGNKR